MCILCNEYLVDGIGIYSSIPGFRCCENVTELPKEFIYLHTLYCNNTKISYIPKEFTRLTHLDCSYTQITYIPKKFTQLMTLYCTSTQITYIPKEFTQLIHLDCTYTKITELPKELTQLVGLNCSNTQITYIPKEFTHLNYLYCNYTDIVEIPKEVVQRNTILRCSNCYKLAKIPEEYKKQYIKEYNFLRVPPLYRLKFNKYKKIYIETIRIDIEIRFNEVYWAPGGKGALELFEKYRNM
jgi:Leucine-rich repeat (LRR) protein